MAMFAIMFMMFVSILFMIEAADIKKEKDRRFKKWSVGIVDMI